MELNTSGSTQVRLQRRTAIKPSCVVAVAVLAAGLVFQAMPGEVSARTFSFGMNVLAAPGQADAGSGSRNVARTAGEVQRHDLLMSAYRETTERCASLSGMQARACQSAADRVLSNSGGRAGVDHSGVSYRSSEHQSQAAIKASARNPWMNLT